MRLVFLGTSAGTPTATRNVTSQALVFDDGRMWLLDCGEGTQHRLLASNLKASRLERILVTHLHGDHSFGLPGLLCSVGMHYGRTAPIEIIGPRGVRELVETALRISASGHDFPVTYTELDAGADLERDGVTISARPLVHRVPCFGYVVREPMQRGHFDPVQAHALGVEKGPAFGALTRGESVQLADGRVIEPSQVMGPDRPGRVVVLLGDTSDSSAISEAGAGCDLLVHEATYDNARAAQAQEWGHSTAGMAGAFAAKIKARTLVLTHFSARFTAGIIENSVDALVREAQAECPGTEVMAAFDGFEIEVPHRG